MNSETECPAISVPAKWILVVEDDDDNREVIVEFVTEAGYLARGVAGGGAALQVLAAERPCLVLADMLMEDMDGHELLLRARRLLAAEAPPFVFLTGAHPSALKDISGVILSKPIDFERLLGVLSNHCAA